MMARVMVMSFVMPNDCMYWPALWSCHQESASPEEKRALRRSDRAESRTSHRLALNVLTTQSNMAMICASTMLTQLAMKDP